MVTDISNEEKHIFEIVNFVSICGIVCTFGIVANIVNMIIFYKQGFRNTVNIGFFCLAISDLVCLMTLEWASICLNPLLASSGVPWFPLEVMYLSGAWPHVCFARITSFITVFVTAERYLSIALPLKVKQIITKKTSILIICLMYFVNIACLLPEYATAYLGWRFVPSRNATLLNIIFRSSRRNVEGIVFVFQILLGMASFVGVVVFTALLVSKLRQSSQFRQQVTSDISKLQAISSRDKKTVKMVVLIASVLIVCYTPAAVISLASCIVGPEFNIRGKYTNICEAMWSVALTVETINSSVNIFIYYFMSSKYRHIFNEIMFRCLRCHLNLQA